MLSPVKQFIPKNCSQVSPPSKKMTEEVSKRLWWEDMYDRCEESIYSPFADISNRARDKWVQASYLVAYLQGDTDWYDKAVYRSLKDTATSMDLRVKDPRSIAAARKMADEVFTEVAIKCTVKPQNITLPIDRAR